MEESDRPKFCEPNVFPNQNVFEFGDMKFFSDFDSGNLYNVNRKFFSQNKQVEKVADYEYNISVANDCQGTQCEKGLSSWFYFGIEGVTPGQKYVFTQRNFNKQVCLQNTNFDKIV